MPRPPEQQSGHEIIREPFLLSSRFATKEAAEVPYNALQQILREREDVDFSVYRILQNWQEEQPTKKPWFVVTLGETPPEPVVKQVTEIINQGEVSPLPNQVVLQLAERRLERIQQGRPYTEAHYSPTVSPRKDRNREKMKRKMQQNSRRQNRGK